jgi:quercetin dioxygenase-like cupin family protein
MTIENREELKGTVLVLKNLVAYQEGSIASRMIINKKAGTITIFSFEKDEGLSEHSAPYDAVVTILEGETEITIGGTPFHVHEGETIIMPANIPHAVSAVTKFKMMLTMIGE